MAHSEIALGVDLGNMVSKLQEGNEAISLFGLSFVELGKKCIEAAAEAQGAAARIAGVFGTLAPEVTEFSETFGRAAGRAGSDIQAMVAKFGGMIEPMLKNKEVAAEMSEGLTEMAVNLSKAAHISADDAMSALQGALAGHGRALLALGISMDGATLKAKAMQDGLGDVSGLSKAQHEMLAYQVIMDQMGQVSARAAAQAGTYDEAQNQLGAATKQAAEAFGAVLLPAATMVVNVLAGLLRIFSGMPAGIAEVASAITGALAPAIQWMGSAFQGLWEYIKTGAAMVRDAILGTIEEMLSGLEKLMNALAATGHADWADKAASGLHSAGAAVEGARTSMTADNMGAGISGAMAPILAPVGEFFKNLGAVLKEDFGAVAGSAAPKVGGVTGADIKAQGGGKSADNSGKGGWSFDDQALAAQDAYNQAELDKWAKWTDDVANAQDEAEQAYAEASAKAMKDLEHSLMEGTGKLGQAISNAMKAAADGGPMAAIASLGASLINSSQAGQQAMNVLNSVFAMFSNTIGALIADILPILGTVQNLLAPVLSALAGVFQAIAPLFQEIGGFLQLLMPVFQGLAAVIKAVGTVIQVVVSVVGEVLNPLFKALAPLFATLGVILQALAPIFQLVAIPLQALGLIFQALTPVFQLLGLIFQGVGIVLIGIMMGVADAWNLIAGVISGIVNGVVQVINWFIDAINSALGWAGVHINDLSQVNLAIDTSGLQNSLNALTSNTYDASDAAGALAASADQATASLTNLPQGYKIALAEFNNMNAAAAGSTPNINNETHLPHLAGGGLVMSKTIAVIGEGGPEMVVPMDGAGTAQPSPLSSSSGSSGVGASMIFNVTIVTNNPEDFWKKLQPIIQRAQVARYARVAPAAPRWGVPNDTR